MEKVTIKEQLNAIVYAEWKELHEIMDCLNLKNVEFDTSNAPTINVKSCDGTSASWSVKYVSLDADDEVRLNVYVTGLSFNPTDEDTDNNTWFDWDDDDFREFVFPGEISGLIERIKAKVNPIEDVFRFDVTQVNAMQSLAYSMQLCRENKVGIIVNDTNGNFLCINMKNVKECRERAGHDSDVHLLNLYDLPLLKGTDGKVGSFTAEYYDGEPIGIVMK